MVGTIGACALTLNACSGGGPGSTKSGTAAATSSAPAAKETWQPQPPTGTLQPPKLNNGEPASDAWMRYPVDENDDGKLDIKDQNEALIRYYDYYNGLSPEMQKYIDGIMAANESGSVEAIKTAYMIPKDLITDEAGEVDHAKAAQAVAAISTGIDDLATRAAPDKTAAAEEAAEILQGNPQYTAALMAARSDITEGIPLPTDEVGKRLGKASVMNDARTDTDSASSFSKNGFDGNPYFATYTMALPPENAAASGNEVIVTTKIVDTIPTEFYKKKLGYNVYSDIYVNPLSTTYLFSLDEGTKTWKVSPITD